MSQPLATQKNEDIEVGKKNMRAKLVDMRRSRAGEVPMSEPTEQEITKMRHAFKSAPNSRRAKEHFQRTLTPDQYLLYLDSQKNVPPSDVPRRRHKAQTKSYTTVDAQTQTNRPAFIIAPIRKMPLVAVCKEGPLK